MPKLFQLLSLLFLSASISAQSIRFVKPSATDANIDIVDNTHVVYPPTGANNGKLLVFLTGSFGSPLGYRFFMEEASKLGYHVIGVQYVNTKAVNSVCATSTDEKCSENVRREIIYGEDLHPDVDVNEANGLYNRTLKLIQYLHLQFPSENWGQYLVNGDILWENTAWAGHSQGGGHSAFVGTIENVDRVIMMGSLDALPALAKLAPWQNPNGATSTSKYFGFAHINDEQASYAAQQKAWEAFEMTNADEPLDIDGLFTIPSGKRCFKSAATPNTDPNAFHGATTVSPNVPIDAQGNLLYTTIWRHMLQTPTSTTGLNNISYNINIYPNPSEGKFYIQGTNISHVSVMNANGQLIYSNNEVEAIHLINLTGMASGLYAIKVTYTNGEQRLSKLLKL